MKPYTAIESTPLKFHHFYHYIGMPILLVLIGYTIATNYTYVINEPNAYTIGYMVCLPVGGIALLAAFIGFFKWKRYAWVAHQIFLIIPVLFGLFILLDAFFFEPSLMRLPEVLIPLFAIFAGILLFAILLSLYYIKRKPLFAPGAAS